ncbi:hypothetical protein [Thiomonas sp. FB-6]|uniref:hypothetical protein n=1 Tax=Thiomonas sp. FB-6 TaxID=1158291 RepID=UPI0012DC1C71|nr:hypothetical protein [Thiomonas sp. FB-6]
MKLTDWLALIGAAAWVPQLVTWVISFFSRSKVVVFPAATAEICYGSFGSAINIGFVFSASQKAALITGFALQVTRSDGARKEFTWTGLNETISEITDAYGNKQIVKRAQIPVALKVGTDDVKDKMVLTLDDEYSKENDRLSIAVVSRIDTIRSGSGSIEEIFRTQEYRDLLQFRKRNFWWIPGGYRIEISVSSASPIIFQRNIFALELSSIDSDRLRSNVDLLESDARNAIMRNFGQKSLEEAPLVVPVNAYPRLVRN